MPHVTTDDGVRLYYEETGTGTPLVFVHEFANDLRGWEAQIRRFSRSYRCIAFNARGYQPSDVPTVDEAYSQERAAADVGAVLEGLGIEAAFLVGMSMGAAAALHYTLDRPDRVRGLVFASGGSGSDAASRARFVADAERAAESFLEEGMGPFVEVMAHGPARVQLLTKNPRAWEEFVRTLGDHSPVGAALTMRNYQARRPSWFEFENRLRSLDVPLLVVAGDEDDPVIETSLFLKRTVPTSGLVILPKTGHAVNLEEPEEFDRVVGSFLSTVERGQWYPRDPLARADRSAMVPDAQTAELHQ